MRNHREIIIAPIMTEKSTVNREAVLPDPKRKKYDVPEDKQKNRYFFRVSLNANKVEIRKAIEKIFDVKIDAVNTIRQRGKVKRIRGFAGKRPDWKKAIVTLKPGQSIPEFDII
ncbi:MAG: 50S ribosomal protein L23 [Candidatus Cloacimonadota bacterium]|nr:50S ribosomal protein L23 [Candidatus Cloacimonadota bacterium]